MRFHHARFLLLVPVLLALISLAVMLLWNAVPAAVFSLPEIGFWHAFGLLLLCRLLFGGLGLHQGLHGIMGGAHRRLHERWHRMNPDERRELLKRHGVGERFRDFHDRFHDGFGHHGGHGPEQGGCGHERTSGHGRRRSREGAEEQDFHSGSGRRHSHSEFEDNEHHSERRGSGRGRPAHGHGRERGPSRDPQDQHGGNQAHDPQQDQLRDGSNHDAGEIAKPEEGR